MVTRGTVTVELDRDAALALLRLAEQHADYTHQGVAVSHAINPLAEALGLLGDDELPPAA